MVMLFVLARGLVGKYGGKATKHPKFGTAKLIVQDWQLGDDQEGRSHSLTSIDLISFP